MKHFIVMALVTMTLHGAFSSVHAEEPAAVAHFDLMPKLVLLSDGTLASYFVDHSGPGLKDDTPARQALTVQYSVDEGVTWSASEHLLDFPAEAGGFGYFVAMADHAGEVHLFLLCDNNTGAVRMLPVDKTPRVQPLARQSLDIWHVKSTGDRTQWTEPRKIWTGRAADLQSVIQLKSGRILLPLSYLVNRNWGNRGDGAAAYTYRGNFDTTAIYSDDDGETWITSPSVLHVPVPDLSSYGGVEPVVAQLNDGRVWMLLRTQMGRFYESFSSDEGASWLPMRPSSILSSDSPAALVTLADSRLVMLWNNCQRYGYAQGARNILHAAISEDDGATWKGYREILRDPQRNRPPPPSGDHGVSYPFALAVGDAVYYSLWVQTVGGRTVERFDIPWLLATEREDDFASGLDGWSTFGTRGVEIIQGEHSDDDHLLRVSKIETDWPAVAVWNFPASSVGELTMRIRLEEGATNIGIILTDHFSVPADMEDVYNSLFNIGLSTKTEKPEQLLISPGEWHELSLAWDAAQGTCSLTLNGAAVSKLPLQAMRAHGVSYLRVRADGKSAGGVLIDAVKAKVIER